MEIEILSVENLPSLMPLVAGLWSDGDIEEETDNFQQIIPAQDELCLLAREQEEYIGFIHVGIRQDYVEGAIDLPVAYVEAVYVKPAFQQQGIARKLMLAAEDWARKMGLSQLASDTSISNNTSIDFHKKIGFEEAARIVCFIKKL
ncbi:aminoglycoside 6'-N-acetyltransferase I [Chitinophaga dinghuensis]|uniref:Aminoglycoside N(6')-acetyltransferase type 1 n=1 Tax=Chitinophaga dinghuensis TaxID=1539050 RepID=A0A327W1K4_9BACT|nr:aminoglycoside 6'-N-acetyltransferase [Chitinophaga dinghuensis]RAJ83201.1 aminoglycoside 6'-N-acetyltransferase I [Chitinophaga dinghuensis]